MVFNQLAPCSGDMVTYVALPSQDNMTFDAAEVETPRYIDRQLYTKCANYPDLLFSLCSFSAEELQIMQQNNEVQRTVIDNQPTWVLTTIPPCRIPKTYPWPLSLSSQEALKNFIMHFLQHKEVDERFIAQTLFLTYWLNYHYRLAPLFHEVIETRLNQAPFKDTTFYYLNHSDAWSILKYDATTLPIGEVLCPFLMHYHQNKRYDSFGVLGYRAWLKGMLVSIIDKLSGSLRMAYLEQLHAMLPDTHEPERPRIDNSHHSLHHYVTHLLVIMYFVYFTKFQLKPSKHCITELCQWFIRHNVPAHNATYDNSCVSLVQALTVLKDRLNDILHAIDTFKEPRMVYDRLKIDLNHYNRTIAEDTYHAILKK
jgi:hypothetical protein